MVLDPPIVKNEVDNVNVKQEPPDDLSDGMLIKEETVEDSIKRLKSDSAIEITCITPATETSLPAQPALEDPMTYSRAMYTLTPRERSPVEPADLSNKKPENVTCVPEIDFIKEDIDDCVSDCSNSSDPDRLEVDMSQVC